MLKVLLKIMYKRLISNKLLTIFTVLGLSLGFTAYILVSLYIKYEKSWDSHNVNYTQIYRVQRYLTNDRNNRDGNNISPHTRGRTLKLIKSVCPEIDQMAVVEQLTDLELQNNTGILSTKNLGLLANKDFLNMFTFKFIEGNTGNALSQPYTIILSKSLAQKFYPNGNAINQYITIESKNKCKVTGVFEDWPLNSHIVPNYLVSLSSVEKKENVNENLWGKYFTYALIKNPAQVNTVNAKIYNLFSTDSSGFDNEKLHLCPLSKIHLSFNNRNDYKNIFILFYLVGVLILIVTAINYINVSTSRSASRINETLMHKISGASTLLMTLIFIAESIFYSLLASGISLVFADLFLKPFNTFTGFDLKLFQYSNIGFILHVLAISVLIGIISGIYPSYYLNRNSVSDLIKGNVFKQKPNKINFRKIMVGFQLISTIFLVIVSIYFFAHIHFLLNLKLGFNIENLHVVKFNNLENRLNFSDVKAEFSKIPGVQSVALSKNIPFFTYGGLSAKWEGATANEQINIRDNLVSPGYFETLGAKISMGRNFNPSLKTDSFTCIINQTAWKLFGWDNPIGKHIERKWVVIGVVDDFHFKDMFNAIEPAVYFMDTTRTKGRMSILFRINTTDTSRVYERVTEVLKTKIPGEPFLLMDVKNIFQNEGIIHIISSLAKTLIVFTLIITFMALFGLFGFLMFIVSEKTKEIGIRKINGCSNLRIFYLLNKELFALLGVSFLIASIAAAYIVPHFPGNYLRPFSWWIPIVSLGIITVLVLAVTVLKTYRAATQNPVKALRYE